MTRFPWLTVGGSERVGRIRWWLKNTFFYHRGSK